MASRNDGREELRRAGAVGKMVAGLVQQRLAQHERHRIVGPAHGVELGFAAAEVGAEAGRHREQMPQREPLQTCARPLDPYAWEKAQHRRVDARDAALVDGDADERRREALGYRGHVVQAARPVRIEVDRERWFAAMEHGDVVDGSAALPHLFYESRQRLRVYRRRLPLPHRRRRRARCDGDGEGEQRRKTSDGVHAGVQMWVRAKATAERPSTGAARPFAGREGRSPETAFS